jgi:hypothetical protein
VDLPTPPLLLAKVMIMKARPGIGLNSQRRKTAITVSQPTDLEARVQNDSPESRWRTLIQALTLGNPPVGQVRRGVALTGRAVHSINSMADELEGLRAEAVLGRLLAAHEAVSRLDERARRSPYRASWMQRLLFHEACACQLCEGDLVHVEDLVLLDGNAFSGAPSMGLSSALEILKIWRAAEKAEASSALKAPRPGLTGAVPLPELAGEAADEDAPRCNARHLEAWRRVEVQAQTQPPLMAAALVWDAWLSLLPESRSAWRATLLAALTLKSRGLTPNLVLPLDVGWRLSKYRRHPRHDLATRIGGFLSWAEAAAFEGQREFDSLVLAEGLLRTSLRGRRSNSRMPALVQLLLERPFVSASLAARTLGVTRQAAHTMLKTLGAPVHRLTDRERCNVWSVIG